MNVAVIGAGAAGTSAAMNLALGGHKVVVFEQFERGHTRGSSHGTSRITRHTYADPYYCSLAVEANREWFELERLAGEQIFVPCGLLAFGDPNSDWLKSAIAGLVQWEVPHEHLDARQTLERFGIRLDAGEVSVFEPGAGMLRSSLILRLNEAIAAEHGAVFRYETPATLSDDGRVNGEAFDAVVICAGAWSGMFAHLPSVPTIQHFAYFAASIEAPVPCWVEATPDHFYGFGDYGRGFKIGLHRYGPRFTPESDPELDPEVLDEIGRVAVRRLGARLPELEAFTCLYTTAPNEDFVLVQVPNHVPVYLISACSGHGFKFSAWFGRLARRLIEGEVSPSDFPRFSPK